MNTLVSLLWGLLGVGIVVAVLARGTIWLFYERKGKIVVWAPWLEFASNVLVFLFWVVYLIRAIQNGESKIWLDILLVVLWLIASICSFKTSKIQYKKNKRKVEESEANS